MLWTRIGRAAAFALIVGSVLPVPTRAEEATLAEQAIDVMNQLFGRHPGVRANHAKGIVIEGSFVPSPQARELSIAGLFQGGSVPLTARFSDATGVPVIPDGDPNANPHGLAVRFHQSDGAEVDIVTNSLAFFLVATGEDFRDLLGAVAASGPDAAKPTALERFLTSHPAAFAAAAADNEAAANELLFMPNNLTDGIEPSDDPLIDARVQAYAVSFQRRSE